jgi:hypothetical protein
MLKVQTTWRIQVVALELHHDFPMQGQPWWLGHGLGHVLGNLRTCGGRRLPSCTSPSCRRLSDGWIDRSPLLGRPMGCIYALEEPWGVLHLALYEIFLGREGNLVSIKSASSRFSWLAALPCRHHIFQVRTPNNANSASRLCATKLCPTKVFIGFLRYEEKIPKTQPRKIICLISDWLRSRDFGGHIS